MRSTSEGSGCDVLRQLVKVGISPLRRNEVLNLDPLAWTIYGFTLAELDYRRVSHATEILQQLKV
jgi:hypothetical protein